MRKFKNKPAIYQVPSLDADLIKFLNKDSISREAVEEIAIVLANQDVEVSMNRIADLLFDDLIPLEFGYVMDHGKLSYIRLGNSCFWKVDHLNLIQIVCFVFSGLMGQGCDTLSDVSDDL